MYDLVIRNGTIVDGTGLPRYRADIGIVGDRIATISRVREKGKAEIDATDQVVTPGFIDGHTHMDAQVFWDPLGSCSCWHGVTTVVMGNCGFTLAPGSAAQRALILANLERAEDISARAMEAAIRWKWTHFREYLDVVDQLPKAINYAANIGHSSLRTYVMNERAFTHEASAEELRAMEKELLDALAAGAIGFTTSRQETHRTPDDGPVASLQASWDEVRHLVGVMGRTGRGILELARERDSMRSRDPAVRRKYNDMLRALAVESGVAITFGIPPGGSGVDDALKLLDETAAEGGRMFGQTHTRGISHLFTFKGRLQFDDLPAWKPVRALPMEEQQKMLQDRAVRERLVTAAKEGKYGTAAGQPRQPEYDYMYVMNSAVLPNPTVTELAAQRRCDPVEVMIDLALASRFEQFFMQFNALSKGKDDEETLRALRHPRTVMTFSDSGAHVNLIMDSSIHTHLLAYWVRERAAFTLEEGVRMITLAPAVAWGFAGRGLLREGCIADINVFDPQTIAPQLPTTLADLPAGEPRLMQKSAGIMATVVGGKVAFANGEHTGALQGRLLRSTASGVV